MLHQATRPPLVAFGFWLLALAASFAAENTNRFTASDIFNLEFAADPQISPDGQRIICVRRFADIMADKNYSALWIINADGAENRPLTTGNRSDSSPRWSPDGTRVAFIGEDDGRPQIYVRWLDSGQTARITSIQHAPAGLAWSPDGKWISFSAFVPDKPKEIAKLPEAPKGAKWADPATVIDKLVYRFDQAGFLKPGYHHLFVVPADGGTPRQISSGNFNHGGPGLGGGGEPVWTPDGKYLIASANRRDDYELEPLDTEVFEFAVADGAVRQLTQRKGPDHSPVVSPDGRLIAYTGFDDRYQGFQTTYLYVMNRDGSGPRKLTAELDRSVRSPRWAGDGKGVFFLYDDQGVTKVAFCSLDGKARALADDVGGSGSAYASGSFSVAANGTFAYTHSRPQVLCDIAVGSLQGSATKVITHVNDDLFANKTLGAVEEIWFESSFDKRKTHGWIMKPPDFDPAKKYPLILEIHGGPFANYGPRFAVEKQIWAAAGYVVFYCNPRGSTSYGEQFGNLIHHAYPGDDFHDLDSGVDAVVARGYIDPEQLFVTGGSGGGVLTCWMIGRTNRFRAAASAYPVINWYSFVLTADITAFVAKYWFPGLPWDNVEHYEKRSLLSVVKNVKTPTMVITGEEDYRTPMSESEQYYQALKLLSVESVLVRVPGEPHGIRRRPSHWVSKVLHIQGWFDQHRKEKPEEK